MINTTLFRLGASVVILVLMTGCSSINSRVDQPLADQRNLIGKVRHSQDDINAMKISFNDLFYAGKHIFSNRFTSDDHYGEGPNGPRRSIQHIADRDNYPFLRFNGLDSQSCLECHLAIGFAPQENYAPDQTERRFAKQLGFTGGGAGFASSAFGFQNFASDPCNAECQNSPTQGVIRNPPHAFGAGYTQTLAEEMTADLQVILEEAKAHPGLRVKLLTKGVSFGYIKVERNGSVNLDDIVGISDDLIVRPFQWRGLASNLRNFIVGAMNFHFSVQPKEFLEASTKNENDKDGLDNEILEGDISAVATFLAFLRPPIESSNGLHAQRVERGRKVFNIVECASCHISSLEIEDPWATIRDPRNDRGMKDKVEKHLSHLESKKGLNKVKQEPEIFGITVPYIVAPSISKYLIKKKLKALKLGKDKSLANLSEDETPMKISGFSRNLNRDDGPLETLPRLPNKNGKINVPLYSDLKRHKMGHKLAEVVSQKTDGGQKVRGDEFLTRPLWGVADTAPWMHDGRALTLTEAILMHGGEDSEAYESILKFEKISDDDKLALRTFLSSLRLPTVH